ncbi:MULTISPECIES: hypothetical protein [unclassified Paenibacillus]|uniref:phage baseplate plug family protein n=1 Tax=unclassified Paenibacillus TaxID=185978 RepID=UPI0009559968|nr:MULTISPECIES: hypothetical protein [unclassified Paenibacillus]ASS66372.1 hypothetical protein CIC07_09570 [Paenibacillus sp. RUD330]SIQ06423.1 hypothetical protein SAMN05880555_0507 [Paenibacillus sp. RU4X]SIQ26548.1 hypothetical protein SAMN05880570_0506 [Paenibacillus sp. RU4T]
MDEYIEIDKAQIPYQFEIELTGELYRMEIQYNPDFDFFTVDLYRGDELLATGQKLVYGVPLWRAIWDERFPDVAIVPYDLAEKETRITWDNLGESVFLYLYEGADGDE